MASFVSSYTLAVGYVILLYFVGKVRSEILPQSRDFASGPPCCRWLLHSMQGDIWAGFYELDVVKNEENQTVQWAPNLACCGTECRHMCSVNGECLCSTR